jgi:hypothetical protein
MTWDTTGKLRYVPNWSRLDGEIEYIPTIVAHATHEAQLWLAHNREVEAAKLGGFEWDAALTPEGFGASGDND